MNRLWLLVAATFLPALAQAQASPWQAEFGVGSEALSRGLADWQQTDLALRRRWAPRAQFELNARRTERFGLVDRELGAGLALPLAAGWDASLGLSASASHHILPRSNLTAGLQHQLGDGWVLGGTLRATHYDVDRASALSLGAERYFGSSAIGEWRAAASLTATRLSGLGSSGSARVQLDRYFGDRGRLGLLVSVGREIDNLGQGALRIADVQSLVLLGRWPLGPAWALNGEIGQTRLGSQYRRSGGRLGVELDF